MLGRLGGIVLGAATFFGPFVDARADALPPLKSLRHLVFAYTYDVRQLTENPDARADNPSNGDPRRLIVRSGNVAAGTTRRGTIEIDIVAATGDNGLVADVRESDGSRFTEPVRCAVSGDSAVIFDPKAVVNVEAQTALRYLSRGFFAPAELKVGSAWPIDHVGTGFDEHASYRIMALPENDRVAIAFDESRYIRGARFIESNEHGAMTYEMKMLVVEKLETKIRKVETIGTRRRSTDEAFGFDLTSDSFANPAP